MYYIPCHKKQYYKPRFLLMYYIFLIIIENKSKYYIIYAFFVKKKIIYAFHNWWSELTLSWGDFWIYAHLRPNEQTLILPLFVWFRTALYFCFSRWLEKLWNLSIKLFSFKWFWNISIHPTLRAFLVCSLHHVCSHSQNG
jgi:hypothetical protein